MKIKKEPATGSVQQSDDNYRMLFQANPLPMWIYDLETLAFLEVNEAAVVHYGYTRDEFLAMTIQDIRPPEDVPRLLENVSKVVDGLDLAGSWRHLKRDGTVIDVEISSHTLTFEGRRAELVLAHNITDRKRAERDILRLNESLEHRVQERTAQFEAANRELESFSYSVSHDLRAPLRSISGFARILLEDHSKALDKTALLYLSKIGQASKRMEQLIDALLEISQISRRELKLQAVNLSRLAREIVTELTMSEPDRNVHIAIADGLTTQADPVLIRNVLQNLLGNAWKYSRNVTPAQISFASEDRNGTRYFCVRDNGAGFDMANAYKLFGAFQRLHGPEYEGAGIGLATVQRIIHRHGGHILAESEPGKGAAFYFTLT